MLNISNLSRQFIIIATLIISISSCVQPFGDNPIIVLKEIYNSKKTKKAVLFMNTGNATTGNSLHVSIENPEIELTNGETGNIFIVDSDHSSAQLDSAAIKLNWLNEEALEISYHSKLRTFKKLGEHGGIKINYKIW